LSLWISQFRGAQLKETPNALKDYQKRAAEERGSFDSLAEVHDLPPIFHYWSNKYVRPLVEEVGFSRVEEFFGKYLTAAAARVPHPCILEYRRWELRNRSSHGAVAA
jgi:hypothetical protein